MTATMKINIWSDVRCPFCYIGKKKFEKALDAFAAAVKQDEQEAHAIGVSGIPFFVFNDRYAVSGAQSPDIFLQALQQSWLSFEQDRVITPAENGEACSPGENCNTTTNNKQ